MQVKCIAQYPLHMLQSYCSINNIRIAAPAAIKVVILEVVIIAVVAIQIHI